MPVAIESVPPPTVVQLGTVIGSSAASIAAEVVRATAAEDALAATIGALVRGHVIQDETTGLTQRNTLAFVGAGVTATDDSGNARTVVTIPGGSLTIQDEGTPLTVRANLNFKGTRIAATDNSGAGTTDVTVSGAVAVAYAYAATVTIDSTTTDIANIGTLTGNITIANPTGTPTDGQALKIRFQQDATGGRTITWGSQFAFGTDVTTALIPTAASSKWIMGFLWNAVDSKWRCLAIARGF